jgi:RNA-directed DNA polymerase
MGQCNNATLVRYADDFVVMARHMGAKIQDFIEQKLEAWLGLKLNRDKTRIVNLRRDKERLEFLGYQIGLAPVRADRRRHYWRMEPSHKVLNREVDRMWEMTAPKYGWKPLPMLIGELIRHLQGWANYYRLG